jgi:transposase
MVPTMLFSGFAELSCEQIVIDGDRHQIDVVLRSTQVTAACPLCQTIAQRCHSHYTPTLADLPISDVPVRLFLHVQKFFCDQPSCPRRIFTERMPAVVAPSARRTQRLLTLQTQLGLALGGSLTARLSQPLKLPASKDTFLRLIRRAPLPAHPTPRILGVDDWALRKGHRYGSVLVDLERQTIIDLLPDRTAETFAAWLQAHPGIEMISRDRASAYAEGARQGAPQALQVADRFHMLQNLAEALRDVFRAHDPTIRAAFRGADGASTAPLILETPPATPRMLIAREQRRQARLAQYEEMRSCRERGMTIEAIAAHTGLSPRTILRWLKAPSFPERQGRAKQASQLDPYKTYLLKRWNSDATMAACSTARSKNTGMAGNRERS